MRPLLLLLFLTAGASAQDACYPLHIGDMWQYRVFEIPVVDSSVYSYSVVSDTFLAGNTYTVRRSSGSSVESYERQSGDSVLVYRPYLQKEILWFDFSRSAGDTVSVTPLGGDTMDVVLRSASTSVYFGQARKTWTFYVNQARHTIDDEYTVVVADSLGVVNLIPDFGPRQYLAGAIISGIVYGTVVGVPRAPQYPTGWFLLSSNFPNPFNSSTTIQFTLPQRSRVVIEIHNAIGQCVSRTSYPQMMAGRQFVKWNGTNLPSGVYYYRITTSVGSRTGKMILLR